MLLSVTQPYMHTSSSAAGDATTRLHCDRTHGYTVKPGVLPFEFCPFCGHRVLVDGVDDAHELLVTLGN